MEDDGDDRSEDFDLFSEIEEAIGVSAIDRVEADLDWIILEASNGGNAGKRGRRRFINHTY